jgi:hypothetical protein
MNNDLISRTSLLRNIGRYGVSIDPYNITRLITQKVLAEPEVDAEPVRRGEWIPSSIDPYDPYFRCSVCNQGYSTIYHDGEEMNYCPNCGAKLDGDNDAAD